MPTTMTSTPNSPDLIPTLAGIVGAAQVGPKALSMLDLRYDSNSGFYQAPPHMKANNGIYIVDDLGRQMVGVEQLLNRWIVPLDRGMRAGRSRRRQPGRQPDR